MWLILFYLASGCLAIQPNNTPQYRPGLSMNEDYPAVFPAPDPQYKEDPLPGIPDDLKEYLKLDFGQGYYEPKCNNPERRPYIEPVYYWPGDTIKLKCRVCEEEQANNGKIKNWAFLDRKIAGKIDKLHLTIKNKNWLPIQQLHTKPPRPVLTPEFTFSSATPIHRPNPHAYQRDGFLIITNSVAATYGLYRCFDYDKTDNLDYIYYLIPYTPILVDSANQRTIRPEYEILERESYKHFDEYHRWRTYPTFIQDKKNGICAGECNDKMFPTSKPR
uniref:Ig-like domain-containing protein n=1 Tax=Bursaphelenchus xylophilus TaxID=6326 RepID=A0A1I7SLY2_BURXY